MNSLKAFIVCCFTPRAYMLDKRPPGDFEESKGAQTCIHVGMYACLHVGTLRKHVGQEGGVKQHTLLPYYLITL